MKARYAYPLLFFVPAAMLALGVLVMLAAIGAGVLWIFVYGDDPWPETANALLMSVASAGALITLGALLAGAHRMGKAREAAGGVSRMHARVALVVSLLLPLLALLHQWQIGNLGVNGVPPNNSSKPTPLRGAA